MQDDPEDPEEKQNPSLFWKVAGKLGALILVVGSLAAIVHISLGMRDRYKDWKDTNVVYFAPRSPNGVIIERSSWTDAELLYDALEIVAITDTGREFTSRSWGRPFGLMKTWEPAKNQLACFVGLKDDDGRMSTLALFDPVHLDREDSYTFDFVGELTDPTNPYNDNHVGQFSINDIELVNVNGEDLVCLTVGDAIVPYPLVILGDRLKREIFRLWHPGAYGSIGVIIDKGDQGDQTPYLLLLGLNNRLSPWPKLPNAGDRQGHRYVIMAINLRKVLELEDDVLKGQGTVKHRGYIPSIPPWKDHTEGGGPIDQKKYDEALEKIKEWIGDHDQLIQYRVFDEVFTKQIDALAISRRQTLASVTYRRFNRESLNRWLRLKEKGEDRAASVEGETWFVYIEVVNGKLEIYTVPEYKMRNRAELTAVASEPLEPFEPIPLQELVEARLAESKREEGRN